MIRLLFDYLHGAPMFYSNLKYLLESCSNLKVMNDSENFYLYLHMIGCSYL